MCALLFPDIIATVHRGQSGSMETQFQAAFAPQTGKFGNERGVISSPFLVVPKSAAFGTAALPETNLAFFYNFFLLKELN